MGLFSNKKKPCPVCGSPTPRLFATVIDGMPICKECAKRADMPDSVRNAMSIEQFRQYIVYYDENKALRDAFEENYRFDCGGWGDIFSMDMTHGLFRWKSAPDCLAIESSCLKSFRILEDKTVLFESSPEGLKCYTSSIPERAQALEPLISQFRIQMEQFRQMEKLEERRKKESDGKYTTPIYLNRPCFESQVILCFTLELTLEHPYWGGVLKRDCDAPKFDGTDPRISDFMRDYKRRVEEVHILATNLMRFIRPDAPEIQAGTPAGTGSAQNVVTDPVAEIQKYKALLDSGAITADEFAAKKRQLLGI